MSNVIVKENESLDSALRRFKRNCAKAGIQQEIRKREHYEKPSVKRRRSQRLLESVSSTNNCISVRRYYQIRYGFGLLSDGTTSVFYDRRVKRLSYFFA